MKENREKFKQFVIEELKDYDEYGEASTEGYAEIITDEAVKLFCQPTVSNSEVFEHYGKPFTSGRDLWNFLTAHYNFTPKT